ncbi:unnamed protein product [Rotaria sp. Silwood2]|nr:unnamed protein product [Rotaria sp. Silwood2]CAF3392365.1 unnamed protein product [Rotaria sp. Silwood2]CAF3484266.1 unnamed protein product [Rotaria sp. Silwood2]CAF4544663.1 unnamed protein product [Rotaria sp. Silwood2]CAF4586457.1 unnamed protein product [Rotaria sp. Silwood2]
MSQSGYSVDNTSNVLPEFAQISSGKGPVNVFELMGSSSCYYVPTQISFTDHGDGFFLQQMGGIKVRPYLEYEQVPIVNLNPSNGDTSLRGFKQRMNQVLPAQNGISPHITGEYGEKRTKGAHGGVDFNYKVPGQRGINLQHPTVNSPVDGKVIFVGGGYGTVKIRTSDGYSHEILHLHTTNVRVGDVVETGQAIGTMGGRGPKKEKQYAQHVHYQVKDPKGRTVGPKEYFEKEEKKQTGSTKP